MAFREFTDSTGVVWQVWDVTVDQIHPVTRGEDFMADMQDGWLAFESPLEKRRMAAPYPADWTEMPLPALEALCHRAPVVSGRKPKTVTGERRAYVAAVTDKAVVEEAQRTFASPQGREWTVRPHECLDKDGNPEVVLRFTADDIVVDLPEWPRNWRDLEAAQYALLLLDAKPPRRPGPGEKAPQRRRDDRPVDAPAEDPVFRDQPLAT